MKHLLDLESLTQDQIELILKYSAHFFELPNAPANKNILAGKTVVNLFYENSTRTRSSFEIAANHLGANVINFNAETSSAKKGESLLDTIDNLSAMDANLFIIRHQSSGAAEFLANNLKTKASILNAGDGCHEHPSQGLLDIFAIQQYKKHFAGLKVAIVGDILHSRVARSLIHGLNTLGTAEVCLVGPKTLMPKEIENLGVNVFYKLDDGIKNADVIVVLRLQKERMTSVYLPSETEYRYLYGIDESTIKLAKPDVIVMHPGPINREVEISSTVADGPHSIILKQVSFGVAVRMAAMTVLLNPKVTL
ncbi:MAG: aspartate carbamoyltransferase catalytic subunit [Gammaproteobacteria bacterium]|nr:aspartate carbamoyltransferase catalytic subunit [Gammaproteobacteria bacterium]